MNPFCVLASFRRRNHPDAHAFSEGAQLAGGAGLP